MEPASPLLLAHRAFCDDNAVALRNLLEQVPELRGRINDSQPESFDAPPIVNVKSREMLDLLLEFGADINAKSHWWAGGFGLLHNASPDLVGYAIQRGARLDIHAAARLGLFDEVRSFVAGDPTLVHARGGDGQTPLHFAATEQIAAHLLDHGADINARDIDHESTPAQWMLGDRPELARFLVGRGCATDLLMVAALGDVELARKHLKADPGCIRIRVNDEYFPKRNHKSGGTIYQWTLGWHVSPHQVAKARGHDEMVRLLLEFSPPDVKLVNGAWMHDEAAVDSVLREHPEIVASLSEGDLKQVAHAARNNDAEGVRLFLKAGFPINARGQHHATPVHWAAWHGNIAAVREILGRNPNLEDTENDFRSSPLGWAIHGSEHGWHRSSGNYPAVVEAFLRLGVKAPDKLAGTPEVQETLKRFSITS